MAFLSAPKNERKRRDQPDETNIFHVALWTEGDAIQQGDLELSFSDVHLTTKTDPRLSIPTSIISVPLQQCSVEINHGVKTVLPAFKLSLGNGHSSRFISVNENGAAARVDETRTLAAELSTAILSAPIIKQFRILIKELQDAAINASSFRCDPTEAATELFEADALIKVDKSLDEAASNLCTFVDQRMTTDNPDATALRRDTKTGGVLFPVLISVLEVADVSESTKRQILRTLYLFLTGRPDAKEALIRVWPDVARNLVANMQDSRSSTAFEAVKVLHTLSSFKSKASIRRRNYDGYDDEYKRPLSFIEEFVAADGSPVLYGVLIASTESGSLSCLSAALGSILNFAMASGDILSAFTNWLDGPRAIANVLDSPALVNHPKTYRLVLEVAILVAAEPLPSASADELAPALRRVVCNITVPEPSRVRAVQALALLRDTQLDSVIVSTQSIPTSLLSALVSMVNSTPWDGKVPAALPMLKAFESIAALPSTGAGRAALVSAGLVTNLVRAFLSRVQQAVVHANSDENDVFSFAWCLRRRGGGFGEQRTVKVGKPSLAISEINVAISALLWLILHDASVAHLLAERGVASELEKLTTLAPQWRNARTLAWALASAPKVEDNSSKSKFHVRQHDFASAGVNGNHRISDTNSHSTSNVLVLAAEGDAEIAAEVASLLRNKGLRVWVDDNATDSPSLPAAAAESVAIVAIHSRAADASAAWVTECRLASVPTTPQRPPTPLFVLSLEGVEEMGVIRNVVATEIFNCASSHRAFGISTALFRIAEVSKAAVIPATHTADKAIKALAGLDTDALSRGLLAAGLRSTIVAALRERSFCGLEAAALAGTGSSANAVALAQTFARDSFSATLSDGLAIHSVLTLRLSQVLDGALEQPE
jgi:hypothetical protein